MTNPNLIRISAILRKSLLFVEWMAQTAAEIRNSMANDIYNLQLQINAITRRITVLTRKINRKFDQRNRGRVHDWIKKRQEERTLLRHVQGEKRALSKGIALGKKRAKAKRLKDFTHATRPYINEDLTSRMLYRRVLLLKRVSRCNDANKRAVINEEINIIRLRLDATINKHPNWFHGDRFTTTDLGYVHTDKMEQVMHSADVPSFSNQPEVVAFMQAMGDAKEASV